MKSPTPPQTRDWARRVNRSWIVRHHLNEHAEAWLDHLEALADGRLDRCCAAARGMCARRPPQTDPKPWFYAGLFAAATAEEARHFLADHRVTKATVPAMVDDESVRLWLDRVGPETVGLVGRLRQGVRDCLPPPPP